MSTKVDLATCDKEPIHAPGSIQSHGCLLACDPRDGRVLRHSNNAAEVLGLENDFLGKFLSEIFDPSTTHDLVNALAKSTDPKRAGLLLQWCMENGDYFDIACHTHAGVALLEFENADRVDDEHDPLELARALIARIQHLDDTKSLFEKLPRYMQAMLGYDRVMLYEFAEDGSGKVVGEVKRPALESFLGQHFPASDIPKQARALYLANSIRVIADASGASSAILPELDGEGAPLDLSFAHLRSVSPIHLEYLRNMGVSASMSISIIVGGKLWGLVACHNYTPKALTMAQRVASELVGDFLSLHITAQSERRRSAATLRAREILDEILSSTTFHESTEEFLRGSLDDLVKVIPADGIGLWMNGTWTHKGIVPPPSAVPMLARLASESNLGKIWSTHSICEKVPTAASFAGDASGMLAIPLSITQPDFLFYFRKEKLQTLEWAGDPHKTYSTGPNGDRLTPRQSFAIWKQTVEQQSAVWSEDDLTAAKSTLLGLREVMSRHNEILTKERKEAAVRMQVLNDELNHRVKNILALIKSLINQQSTSATDLEAFVSALKGRIIALSHAHDQVVRTDGGGSFEKLLRTELSPYPNEQTRLMGPDVCLDARAYSVMALVIHELATNAAKYGPLTVPEGTLTVTWSITPDGLKIHWQESDGPIVQKPTREGFGSVLLHRSVPFDLQGSSDIEYRESGLIAKIVIPAKYIVSETAQSARWTTKNVKSEMPVDGLVISGRRGLVIEDQLVIALEAEDMLRSLGAEHVTTVATVFDAREILEAQHIDFAVLDLNLGSHNSLELAELLRQRGVPFIFATGYGDSIMIPASFREIPVVRKPYTEEVIGAGLAQALADSAVKGNLEKPDEK